MFIAKVTKSCLLTYIGLVFGVLAAFFAFTKMALIDITDDERLRYALIFLILSGVCDMFDGKVARMCKRTKEEKQFGIQLDSLADTFNFIAVPVIIMLSMKMTHPIALLAYALFVIAGVMRLAYFNVHADEDKPVKYYTGLPVTSTAITWPVLGLLKVWIGPKLSIVYLIATFLTAFLFIFNFKCPKLKGKAYIVIPILAAVLIAFLLFFK